MFAQTSLVSPQNGAARYSIIETAAECEKAAAFGVPELNFACAGFTVNVAVS